MLIILLFIFVYYEQVIFSCVLQSLAFSNIVNMKRNFINSILSCLSERFTCNFDLLYMLEALFSRGYIVLNLLSTVEDREEFFSTVYESYTKDVRLTIGALERVLLYIDSGNEVSLLTRMFKRQYDLLRKIKYFKSSSNDEQYVMIRKVSLVVKIIIKHNGIELEIYLSQ